MLNLSLVKTFVMLVETGSFSGAARRLDLAQPTVSQHLQKLEAMLGLMLIERGKVACKPTPKGRTLLPYARSLLSAAARFEAAVDGSNICIGCSGNIAAYYISSELKRFVDAEDNPISWEICAATNPEVATQLASGTIDLAAMEWPAEQKEFDLRTWRVEPLVVIVHRNHLLANAGSISVDDLLQLDLIGGEPGSGTGTVLRKALGSKADKLRITHTLHSTEAVKNAVQSGLGCSIVLHGAVRDDVEAGLLRMLSIKDVPLEKTFYLAVPAGLPEEALPARLVSFLAG